MKKKIDIVWENTFDISGYGIWGRKCVESLLWGNKYNVKISPRGVFLKPDDILYKLQYTKVKNPIKVINLIPLRESPPTGDLTGYCTCTEIKNPPQEQIDNMNKAKFVIALSSFSEQVYKDALDEPEKVFRVNFPIFRGEMSPYGEQIIWKKINKKFKFLFVGRIDVRKNIKALIRGFKQEFGKNRNVVLILKVYSPDYNIPMWIKEEDPTDNIVWLRERIKSMDLLYRSVDAYVTADLGEAWSAPTQEAMLCGLPTIAPRHSGHLDYMNDENSWLVDVSDWREIGRRKNNLYSRLLPENGLVKYPNVTNLRTQMRTVYETFKGKSKAEVYKHPKIKNAMDTVKITDQATIYKQLDKCFTWVREHYGDEK